MPCLSRRRPLLLLSLAGALLLGCPAAAGALTWSAPQPLPLTAEPVGIAADAGGAATILVQHSGRRDAIAAIVRGADGTLGRPIVLSRASEVTGARLAGDGAGEAAAVWQRAGRDVANPLIEARVRRGSSWGSVQRLTTGRRPALSPDVAMNARGEAVATWHRFYPRGKAFRVEAAIRGAGSRRFGATQVLHGKGKNVYDARAAINDGGVAAIAWRTSPGNVRVSVRSPGRRFGNDIDLGRWGFVGDIAVAADGTVLLTVQNSVEGPDPVLLFVKRPGSGFGSPVTLTTADGAARSRLAVSAGGAAVAYGSDSGSTATATLRRLSDRFEPGEPVALPADAGGRALLQELVIDASGRPTAFLQTGSRLAPRAVSVSCSVSGSCDEPVRIGDRRASSLQAAVLGDGRVLSAWSETATRRVGRVRAAVGAR